MDKESNQESEEPLIDINLFNEFIKNKIKSIFTGVITHPLQINYKDWRRKNSNLTWLSYAIHKLPGQSEKRRLQN